MDGSFSGSWFCLGWSEHSGLLGWIMDARGYCNIQGGLGLAVNVSSTFCTGLHCTVRGMVHLTSSFTIYAYITADTREPNPSQPRQWKQSLPHACNQSIPLSARCSERANYLSAPRPIHQDPAYSPLDAHGYNILDEVKRDPTLPCLAKRDRKIHTKQQPHRLLIKRRLTV